MLTDYHVHLRPDDPRTETTAARYFTDANVARYRETATERGIEELGIAEHIYRFTAALDVWQHPFWAENAVDDLDDYCAFVRGAGLKLGIEADFIAGTEDRMANLLEARDWDYVVGSVHFISDGAVDMPGKYDVWTSGRGANEVWRRYFETMAASARSGLFDIIAHPDLVKIWGRDRPLPDRDPRFYYEPFVEALLEGGAAVEVSTAGLRKPVGEIYPAPALLEMIVDAGVPVALSSDAHQPDLLGFRYEETVELLRGAGVGEIAVFSRRERRMAEIG